MLCNHLRSQIKKFRAGQVNQFALAWIQKYALWGEINLLGQVNWAKLDQTAVVAPSDDPAVKNAPRLDTLTNQVGNWAYSL
jgi:hypothetical protein